MVIMPTMLEQAVVFSGMFGRVYRKMYMMCHAPRMYVQLDACELGIVTRCKAMWVPVSVRSCPNGQRLYKTLRIPLQPPTCTLKHNDWCALALLRVAQLAVRSNAYNLQ